MAKRLTVIYGGVTYFDDDVEGAFTFTDSGDGTVALSVTEKRMSFAERRAQMSRVNPRATAATASTPEIAEAPPAETEPAGVPVANPKVKAP